MTELYTYLRTLEWVNRNTEFASIFARISRFCPSVSILQYQQPFFYTLQKQQFQGTWISKIRKNNFIIKCFNSDWP